MLRLLRDRAGTTGSLAHDQRRCLNHDRVFEQERAHPRVLERVQGPIVVVGAGREPELVPFLARLADHHRDDILVLYFDSDPHLRHVVVVEIDHGHRCATDTGHEEASLHGLDLSLVGPVIRVAIFFVRGETRDILRALVLRPLCCRTVAQCL